MFLFSGKVTLCFIALAVPALAVPVPMIDLDNLPDITYDSLKKYQPPLEDSQTSETGMGTMAVATYMGYNALRNMLRSDPETESVLTYLSPFRLVRNVYNTGRKFATTFQQEYQNQYKALSAQRQTQAQQDASVSASDMSPQYSTIPFKVQQKWGDAPVLYMSNLEGV